MRRLIIERHLLYSDCLMNINVWPVVSIIVGPLIVFLVAESQCVLGLCLELLLALIYLDFY